jgi:hypothetical protein
MSESASQQDSDSDIKAQIAHWDDYLKKQQQQREEAAAGLQTLMDQSGLTQRGIDPFAEDFKLEKLDLSIQKELSLRYGLGLDRAEDIPKKPSATRWRQRTSAMKV